VNHFGFVSGFLTLVLPAILGYWARKLNLISEAAEGDLNRLVYHFALPAMVLSNLFTADLRALFGPQLLVQIFVIIIAIIMFMIGNRLLPGERETGGPLAIATMSAFYANLGNIGMPIAIALFGDASIMVPFILLQQLIFMPIALALLERATTGSFSAKQLMALPFKNPLLLTAFFGLIIAAFRIPIPELISRPIQVVGQGAVPMVMIGFGAGLVGRKMLDESRHRAVFAIAIKSVIMPLIALAVVTILHLELREAMIAVMVAGLPTAGNVYNFAHKFNTGLPMARNTVAATTIISPIVIAVLALAMAA